MYNTITNIFLVCPGGVVQSWAHGVNTLFFIQYVKLCNYFLNKNGIACVCIFFFYLIYSSLERFFLTKRERAQPEMHNHKCVHTGLNLSQVGSDRT